MPTIAFASPAGISIDREQPAPNSNGVHQNVATTNGALANGNASVTHTPIVIKSSGKIDALVDMAYTELGKAWGCCLACMCGLWSCSGAAAGDVLGLQAVSANLMLLHSTSAVVACAPMQPVLTPAIYDRGCTPSTLWLCIWCHPLPAL